MHELEPLVPLVCCSGRSGEGREMLMGRVDKTMGKELAEAVINRTLVTGVIALVALVVLALIGGEAAATAAVAVVGTIVVALVRLASSCLNRPNRPR
ncbi:hypothetical protein [Micromonospora sp. NPDC049374]|uniref:hypothetical protein n=1 Tax=Micromonospora sp. NPDC049374 TaxID=3154352 RepID=UPI0034283C64